MTRRLGVVAATVVAVAAVLAAVGPGAAAKVRWDPKPGLRWQYQLQGKIDTSICSRPAKAEPANEGACVRPDVWVIDLYNNDGTRPNAGAVQRIHARKARAVCYVDAGTWESWRPDAARYPASIRGKSNGWPGERWLDIRAIDVLRPLIAARVDKCVKAGFDAVDFDNVEGYANDTGFPLTGPQQLAFNKMLAKLVHDRGLAVGLKNDLGQAAKLRGSFDFAVNEQCYAYHECWGYDSWPKRGRPVIEIEYANNTAAMCAAAAHGRRDAMHKALALKPTPWVPCR